MAAFGTLRLGLGWSRGGGGETAVYLASGSYASLPPGNPDESREFGWSPDFDIFPTRTGADYTDHTTGTAIYVDPAAVIDPVFTCTNADYGVDYVESIAINWQTDEVYLLELEISDYSAGSVRVDIPGQKVVVGGNVWNSNGAKSIEVTVDWTPGSRALRIGGGGPGTFTGVFSDVSLRLKTGEDTYGPNLLDGGAWSFAGTGVVGAQTGAGTETDPAPTLAGALSRSTTLSKRKIYAKPGRYYHDLPANHLIAGAYNSGDGADAALAVWPGDTGRVQLISGHDPADLSWSADGGGRYSTTAAASHLVVDFADLDEHGMPTPLEAQASAAAVTSNGGFYVDGSTVYVNAGREPDADIVVMATFDSVAFLLKSSWAFNFFAKDWDFFGHLVQLDLQNGGEDEGLLKLDNCRFGYSPVDVNSFLFSAGSADQGVEIRHRNCVAAYSGQDGFNYNYGRILEEAVTAYESGLRDSTPANQQNSTIHFGARIIRVAGYYGAALMQSIADVSSPSRVWAINCDIERSGGTAVQVGQVDETMAAWFDGCRITGNLSVSATSAAYSRGSAVSGSGSFNDTY